MLTYGSIVVASMALCNTWLISRKRRIGWALACVSNSVGGLYDILTRQPGFFIMSLILLAISVKTWFAWKEDDERHIPEHSG